MFCSNCGKTLPPESKTCKHCGFEVGESPFSSTSYTSAQSRHTPEHSQDPAEERGYPGYTRTTYTSMEQPEGEGDVYSRTTYRPVLPDEPQAEEAPAELPPEQPDEPQADYGEDDLPNPPLTGRTPAQPEETEAAAEGEAEPEKSYPLEPIKKAGIRPEVARYMQEAEEAKKRQSEKGKHSFALPKLGRQAQPEEEAPTEDAPEQPEGEAAQTAGGETTPAEGAQPVRRGRHAKPESTKAKKSRKLAGILAIGMVIVAMLVGGIWFLNSVATPKADVPGVTYELFVEGKQLIASHATDDYRKELMALASSDPAALSQRQQADLDAIQALLPEKPLENDALFIEALTTIQTAINTATTVDSVAAQTTDENVRASLVAESERDWSIVQNALNRMQLLKEKKDLNNLITVSDIANNTPEPQATVTPTYTTLKKGMNDNPDVKKLQNRLYELGYFTEVRDADYGAKTARAVKAFQEAAGLQVDGIATAQVQQALYAEDAPRAPGSEATPPAANATLDPNATPGPDATGAPEATQKPE